MKYIVLGWLLIASFFVAKAQPAIPKVAGIQLGDLVFVNTNCGPMCDAINSVTTSKYDLSLSHMGFVLINEGDTLVLEAISTGVSATPWQSFLAKHQNNLYIGRWKGKYQNPFFLYKMATFCWNVLGAEYDNYFAMDNGMYYCSELIYDAAMYGNDGQPVFELQPMTFINPKTKKTDTGWVDFFKALDVPVPEGEPGINPGGMSMSKHLDFYKFK